MAPTLGAPAGAQEEPGGGVATLSRGGAAARGEVGIGLSELETSSGPGSEPLPPSINGRYRPIKLLGRGGMGAVYQARDEELRRDVALKFLLGADADLGQRLLREARAQARIDHENVCKVYEVGVADGRRYIAMQLIHGDSLDHARDRMTLEEKVKVLQRAALALHEAHRLTMVHRDVKPSNILLERGDDGAWKPYVMDFGIARDAGDARATATGALAGTPAYMAPEQARGEVAALDRRTDVYSLGATLYDVLAGHPPFVEDSLWKLLHRITNDDAPPIRAVSPRIPEDIEAILMKCLEREPHRRYESARALSDDLQRFLDGEPVLARRRSFWYVAVRKAKKHRLRVALVGAALLTGLFFVALWARARAFAEQQSLLGRELGEDMKEMELFLRSAHQLPLHDVERERSIVRRRLTAIEARMREAGSAGEGPGRYALGRGHLALHEPEEALADLRRAGEAGYASPDLDYALGLALGALYSRAVEEARRIEEPSRKKAREETIDAEYKRPALLHLRAALGARLEAPAYAEGLIALYDGRPGEAAAKAREAFGEMPWLYEAKALEGDAELAEGRRFGHDAAFDHARMMEHFRRAADAYRVASEIAASDPEVYLGECELWAQTMNAASSQEDVLKASFERAQAACRKAIEASPADDAGRLKLAFVKACFAWWIATTVRVDDAEKTLRDAVVEAEEVSRRRPDDPLARYVEGLSLRSHAWYTQQRGLPAEASLDRAVAAYESALRLDPTFLWALNDLCSTHSMKGESEALRGVDPTASLDRAVAHCRRAVSLQPGALYAWHFTTVSHFMMAEHQIGAGRDPAASMELARKAIEAGRALSPDWPWAYRLQAHADWLQARRELDLGLDPAGALERAQKSAEEYDRRDPSSPGAHEMIGHIAAVRALSLFRRGEDPGPALRDAGRAFQRAIDSAPWDLGYRVFRARVEILALRWAARQRTLRDEQVKAALALLAPLLDRERVDPRLHEALAEIHAVRAEWAAGRGADPTADIDAGLSRASQALALHPHMAAAFATRGALLLVRARAARPGAGEAIRAEAALAAVDALSAAIRENPTLERETAAALAEARALAGGAVPGTPAAQVDGRAPLGRPPSDSP